jgi:hypothetical protein
MQSAENGTVATRFAGGSSACSASFPASAFEVREVLVKGWPWYTVAAVEWRADVMPAGPCYVNEGVHVVHLRWGRVVSVHAYENSQAVAEASVARWRAGSRRPERRPSATGPDSASRSASSRRPGGEAARRVNGVGFD